MFERRFAKKVNIGGVTIGGNEAIAVQSMLNRRSDDFEGSIAQAKQLEAAGCDIVRAAVPDMPAVKLIHELKKNISIPVVADIHFDYKLALECVEAGVDKIRINPGNIGSQDRVKAVADKCKSAGVPIRIGVNSGSVEKEILKKYGSPTPMAMAESALYHASLLERFDFDDIVISIKSSNVQNTVRAYEIVSGMCSYPLHIGVTEAGTKHMGIIKSAAGIGSLLAHGIGDTIRVSLTDEPVEEIKAGIDILKALNLRQNCVEIVSCPTCGRTRINMIEIADKVTNALADCHKPLKVAVMGCAVNGPGEAREADIGIAGGDGCGLIFKKGEIVRKVPEERIVEELLLEIEKM